MNKQDLIDEYIDLAIDIDQLADAQVRQVSSQLSQMGETLDEEGEEKLHKKMTSIMEGAVSEVAEPILQTVSDESLEEMIEFLRTDAGQEMIELQPMMQEQAMAYVMENMTSAGQEIEEILLEHTVSV